MLPAATRFPLLRSGGGVAKGDGGGGFTQAYPVKIALPLFDPLRREHRLPASRDMPRISIPGWSEPAPLPVPHTPYDAIDARRLTLRLAALARALDDLPREARRFARWRSRSESPSPLRGSEGRARQATRPERGGGGSGVHRISPLRGGAPPGQPSIRRQTHEIHRILDDVHGLAFWALEAPDTS